MPRKFILNHIEIFLLAAAAFPLVFVTCMYINLNFWNDEMYTLKFFTFVPLTTTLTDYHIPNNHIFFNLLNNIYFRIIGITNVWQLMNTPYLLRIIPLLYSLGTIIYLYLTGRRFFNSFVAVLAVTILLTTIPFYNYFLQVRGYGPSMFFLSMMNYHSFSLQSSRKLKDFLLLALAACLSVYTIPLNLYYIFSIGIFYGIHFIIECFVKLKYKKVFSLSFLFKSRSFHILLALVTGTACALLLYIPIFKIAFFSDYVKSEGWFAGSPFTMIANCGYAFLSGRYLLILFAIAGVCLYARKATIRKRILLQRFLLLLAVLLIPFITSYTRYDEAPDRSFSILVTVFALCLSSAIYFLLSNIPLLLKHRITMLIALIIYCQVSFAYSFSQNRNHILNNVKGPDRLQDIYYNYYLAYFHPKKITEAFKKQFDNHPAPLLIKECDYWSMYEYLNKLNIKYTLIISLDTLRTINNDVYLLDIRTDAVEQWMRNNIPDKEFKNINPFVDFQNFYLVRRSGYKEIRK